jgi:hypothetical protein
MAERKLIQRGSQVGCSECEWVFKPRGFEKPIPALMGTGTAVQIEFDAHDCAARSIHKKTPREDVNQAAARIVREATERD